MTVRAGRVWRTWAEWSTKHPGVPVSSLPKNRFQRREFPEKLSRDQVIAWLWDNLDSVVISADFAEEFRPPGLVWKTTADDARKGFYALAGLALKHCGDGDEHAGCAISLLHVATALGLKEKAAQAAKIINCCNASVTASYGLTDMIEAGRTEKS